MISRSISARFGETIRARRIQARLTQEAVAESAGLHPTYIGMVERGVRKPTLDAAARMASALKVPHWQLVKASEAATPSPKAKR